MVSPPFSPFFFNQRAEGERINKETGELSASGELSVCVELNVGKVAGPSQKLPQELREQLKVLGIDTCPSPDHRTDHVPLEERERLLLKVLPLYIQVLCV